MTGPVDLQAARRRAALRRVGREVGATPAAITQFEKGQAKPTLPVLHGLAAALITDPEFFRAGPTVPGLPASGAHFRSLRSTTSLERERALAFGEVVLAVLEAVERYVQLPPLRLPELDVPPHLDHPAVHRLAIQAREALSIPAGPIPHAVRLLEAHGVLVVALEDASAKVDAFSHPYGHRPLVLLNPAKQDKARSRFDATHELGHLLMHHDVDPGSRLVEQQAHAFAAEFLAPAEQVIDDLPARLDWVILHQAKRRWGISLKALIVRAHHLGRFNDSTYQRGLRQLATWGLPERGPLGPPEVPALLPRALELIGATQPTLRQLATDAGLPLSMVELVWRAAGGGRTPPTLTLAERDQ